MTLKRYRQKLFLFFLLSEDNTTFLDFSVFRVRLERKSSTKRKAERERRREKKSWDSVRKCGAAVWAAISSSLAHFPAGRHVHCAARPCRGSMACSVWVSNTNTHLRTRASAPLLMRHARLCSHHRACHSKPLLILMRLLHLSWVFVRS